MESLWSLLVLTAAARTTETIIAIARPRGVSECRIDPRSRLGGAGRRTGVAGCTLRGPARSALLLRGATLSAARLPRALPAPAQLHTQTNAGATSLAAHVGGVIGQALPLLPNTPADMWPLRCWVGLPRRAPTARPLFQYSVVSCAFRGLVRRYWDQPGAP